MSGFFMVSIVGFVRGYVAALITLEQGFVVHVPLVQDELVFGFERGLTGLALKQDRIIYFFPLSSLLSMSGRNMERYRKKHPSLAYLFQS